MPLFRSVADALTKRTPHSGQQIQESKSVVYGGALLAASREGKALATDEWSFDKAVERGYKASPLSFIGIKAIAAASTTIQWIAAMKDSEGNWIPQPEHDLTTLLARPNPFFSGADMMERFMLHALLGGNGIIRKILLRSKRVLPGATSRPIAELWNAAPEGFRPVPDKRDWIKEWRFEYENKTETYPTDEIVHFMFCDPSNDYWGMSPLQPLAKVIDTEKESIEWNIHSMLNRAVASGVFSSDKPMTSDAWEEYRQMIQSMHMGASNAQAPWVLGGGFKWSEMSRTPVEMDFVSSLAAWREVTLSGLGVPPVMAGFFDSATLANAEVSRRMFWIDVMLPLLNRVRQVFNRSLVPHFAAEADLRIGYDVGKVEALRDDTKLQADTFYQFQRSGVPYDEASEKLGIDLKPQSDKPYGVMTPPGGAQTQRPDSGSGDDGDGTSARADEEERPDATQKIDRRYSRHIERFQVI